MFYKGNKNVVTIELYYLLILQKLSYYCILLKNLLTINK